MSGTAGLMIFATASVLCAPNHALSQRSVLQGRLTSEDIREAIELGMKEQPQPYMLRHVPPRGSSADNPTIVAAAYTPFLRVAIAASDANRQGRTLAAADLKPSWLEPLVYIVVRSRFGRGATDDVASLQVRYVAPTGEEGPPLRLVGPMLFRPESRVAVEPSWERPARTVLSEFGGAAPFDDADVVAAFPVRTLVPNGLFVIYRPDQQRKDGSFDLRIAIVGGEASGTWR